LPTVLVLGAGAVGSLFGARLSAAGNAVILVGRPAHVDAVRTGGLTVEGVDPGRFRPEASAEIPRDRSLDLVLVTVKSYDLATALGELADTRTPLPTVLLGNGLGIEATASRLLAEHGWREPERWCLRAVHTVPATYLGAGRVRASGTGEVVLPDPSVAGPAAPLVPGIGRTLVAAGFRVRTSSRFDEELWRKVVVNAAINPVTAAHAVPNGALRAGPLRTEAERLLVEAVAVAQRSGVELTEATARADLDRVVAATAENRSSMLQDVDRGRPTELDVISGELLRRGRSLGVAMPATEAAVAAVRRRLGDRQGAAQG
jgi:2-dehydropantoate 2-reductase